MGLPKEPRQKMINLMYLVLTALLALNVSNEILNAFKTVNNSLTNANGIIDGKNALLFKSFEDKLKNPATSQVAGEWKPVADNAKKIADDIQTYIEDLKMELKKTSGLRQVDGVEEFKEDDLDGPTRLLAEGPKGADLKAKLEKGKADLLALIKDPADKAKFDKSFPINTEMPPVQNKELKNWQSAYFHMTPTIAALTMLTKFENDVKNSGAQVIEYAHRKTGEVIIIFDQYKAFVGTNATYLMPGQDLEITAGIGSFSSQAKPTVIINGSPQPLGEDGAALYKTKAESVGAHSIDVVINYTDQKTGKPAQLTKKVEYTVGQPGGAQVTADKMNVFYREVANPITISGGSAGLEKVSVSMTNGTLNKTGNGKYDVTAGNGNEAIVTITAEGKSTPFKFRVKDIPNPLAMVGTKNGGTMPTAEFKAQGGLRAVLDNFDFDAKFQVVSYKLGGQGRGIGEYAEANNTGAPWTGAAATIVGKAQPGAAIYFDDIRAVGPTGKQRKLSPIYFTLR